jgi:hypothetical protein
VVDFRAYRSSYSCLPALPLLLVILAPTANAVPIVEAKATADLGGVLTMDGDTSASAANAAVTGTEHTGQGAADISGKLAASAEFFGASGTQSRITGEALWTDTFSGPSARFDFVIPEAAIGFEANNVPSLFGSFFVDISLNGVSVFSAGAEITTILGTPQNPGDLQLTQTGTTDLTAVFATDIAPTFGLGGAGYRFDTFTGSLDLLGGAGTNTVEYRMSSLVDGLIGETSALAFVGDPLNLSQQPGGVTLIPGVGPAVPVPSPVWLMLIGLTALVGRRVRA